MCSDTASSKRQHQGQKVLASLEPTPFSSYSMEIGTNHWEQKMIATKYHMGTASTDGDHRPLQTLPWRTEQICLTLLAPQSMMVAGQPVSLQDSTLGLRKPPA